VDRDLVLVADEIRHGDDVPPFVAWVAHGHALEFRRIPKLARVKSASLKAGAHLNRSRSAWCWERIARFGRGKRIGRTGEASRNRYGLQSTEKDPAIPSRVKRIEDQVHRYGDCNGASRPRPSVIATVVVAAYWIVVVASPQAVLRIWTSVAQTFGKVELMRALVGLN
jgi:hypothetical protein